MKEIFNSYRLVCLTMLVVITAVFTGGCSSEEKPAAEQRAKQIVTDSIGRKVEVPKPVKKVVVSNGYNTELINALGAIDCVIGVDNGIYQNQDAYRGRFKPEQIIGQSQRELNYEKIIELNPEVLILTGNGAWEDAEKKLGQFGIKVIVLDAYYTEHFKENWLLAGQVFGKEKEALEMTAYFESKLAYIQKQLQGVPQKTLYFEYRREGNSTVPGDYFYKMVEYAGAKNIFDDAANVQVNPEAVVLRNPEFIVKVGSGTISAQYLPPGSAEFAKRKKEIAARAGWDEINAVKNGKILLLSHYSHGSASKLVGAMYIAKYLYPEYLPDLHPEQVFKEWLEKYQRLEYVSGHTDPPFSFAD
ncbi:ABC transporter substrate-binding protein [Anaerospora hongkongensis]|uniref:ABC transporter substrate-binding protein n=1 Tax=Anaerospora hongkongensis TaxID=244830 RepID=UPI00289CA0B0|nr:ABC transporter substrate-binding protein [Anaerospora hongkongensis]